MVFAANIARSRRFTASTIFIALTLALLISRPAQAQSLRGSPSSLARQNTQARQHDYTFLKDRSQVRRFVDAGLLVPLRGDANYTLKDVSFPYARPEVRLFVQRLSSQFRAACGERLVVTSLTRPKSNQPRNASDRSVHPTGMALDLRRHDKPACRNWLERVLLSLERAGILEATLERRPPHYHVALFPRPYAAYVARITGGKDAAKRFTDLVSYRVKQQDTLWRIARDHGTTPDRIQAANGLRSTQIQVGQTLKVPLEPGQ